VKIKLIEFLAQACHYAQEHCDDATVWDTSSAYRQQLLRCVSYQVSCFLAQNTRLGGGGVAYDIVLDALAEYPGKSIGHWERIIESRATKLGGWGRPKKNYAFTLAAEIEDERDFKDIPTDKLISAVRTRLEQLEDNSAFEVFDEMDAETPEKEPPGEYEFDIVISGCSRAQAEQVLRERLGHDEDYGFPYHLKW
jgi:hypothetical protein